MTEHLHLMGKHPRTIAWGMGLLLCLLPVICQSQTTNYQKLYANHIRHQKYFTEPFFESDTPTDNSKGYLNDYFAGWEYIYVDDDDIPELVLLGNCEATGNVILSVQKGRVTEFRSDRLGLSYIPRSGLICNEDGIHGAFYARVYRLDLNFHRVLHLSSAIDFEKMYEENSDEIDETEIWEKYIIYYKGSWEQGVVISKKEYNDAFLKAYLSNGEPIHLESLPTIRDMEELYTELGL